MSMVIRWAMHDVDNQLPWVILSHRSRVALSFSRTYPDAIFFFSGCDHLSKCNYAYADINDDMDDEP